MTRFASDSTNCTSWQEKIIEASLLRSPLG